MTLFNELATKIEPAASWQDLDLPLETQSQLRDICHQAKTLQSERSERGFNILFSGPSGTGKTLSAEVIAADLGYPLYRIDLAAIANKYIGETEKNLNALFTSDEGSNYILFFDEADALFGKRTEVQDAHDRYANLDTAYLLKLLESHSGMVILATNSKQAIDPVFHPALQFMVDFPAPAQKQPPFWRNVWRWISRLFVKST